MQGPALACPPELIRKSLAPDALLQRAAALAGLSDFGADPTPALRVLCELFGSLPLTQQGLTQLCGRVTKSLVTRLRLVNARQQTPELFEGSLRDPLVIVGLPRTGTSRLQQLLASLPGNRFLASWEIMEPIPDAQDDDRIARYELLVSLLGQGRPLLLQQHEFDAHGPEECMFLLDPSLVSLSFVWFNTLCPAYFDWVHDPSHQEPYRIYRELLLYLQASAPEKRLILKAPAHFGQLRALLSAVPEARLVHTHRDPVDQVPSMCRGTEVMAQGTALGWDGAAIGREVLRQVEMLARLNAHERRRLSPERNFDLLFTELTRDPFRSIQRLHTQLGLDFPERSQSALRATLEQLRPPPRPPGGYSLDRYGLDAAEVKQRLRDYRAEWGFD